MGGKGGGAEIPQEVEDAARQLINIGEQQFQLGIPLFEEGVPVLYVRRSFVSWRQAALQVPTLSWIFASPLRSKASPALSSRSDLRRGGRV